MSLAYYIVLDVEEPGFETFVNGKAIAHAVEDLDALCQELQLPILDSFMGQGIAEFEDFLDEDFNLANSEDGEEKWYKPEAGITLINSLIATIKTSPSTVTDPDEVIADFQEYLDVLEKAKAINASWYLAIDF